MGPELLRRRPEPADFYFQSTEAAFCKTNNLPGPAHPPHGPTHVTGAGRPPLGRLLQDPGVLLKPDSKFIP